MSLQMRPLIQVVQKRLPAPPLIRRIEMSGFASILFVLAVIYFVKDANDHSFHTSGDLPKLNHVVELDDATREDAMFVSVTRDGKIFFNSDRIRADDLPRMIRDCLNSGSKPKVYFRVDPRARAGDFADAYEQVRASGIQYVAILAYQRKPKSQQLPQ